MKIELTVEELAELLGYTLIAKEPKSNPDTVPGALIPEATNLADPEEDKRRVGFK